MVYRQIRMLTGSYRARNEWRGEVTSLLELQSPAVRQSAIRRSMTSTILRAMYDYDASSGSY